MTLEDTLREAYWLAQFTLHYKKITEHDTDRRSEMLERLAVKADAIKDALEHHLIEVKDK